MHTLVGAGKADGAMDASNLLKPALARGELHCVGATTLDEYRKHVEKDAALARRFQPVFVDEPTVEDTISILRGLKEKYELHHGCASPMARWWRRPRCPTATSPTASCPTRRSTWWTRPPARLRMQVDSKPEELDELDRRIMQLKIEREALKKETDEARRTGWNGWRRNWPDWRRSPPADGAVAGREEKLGLAAELKKQLDEARNELARRSARASSRRPASLPMAAFPSWRRSLSRPRRERQGRCWSRNRDARPRISRRSSRAGPAFRSTRCWKASAKSCCAWKTSSPSASSARARR
jgi:ATP-dependent Clp protease ATP-binding subunit ClpB